MHITESGDPDFGSINFFTSYYTIDKGQNISAVLQASLNELTDKMSPNVLDALGKRLGSLLKNGKFTIGAFSLEAKSAEEKNIVVRDQLISILSNLIEAVKKEGENKRRDGVLIVI